MPRRLWIAAALLAALGCGGPYQFVPVSGKVTLNGQPLPDAWVNFQPIGTKDKDPGPGSVGKTDAQGRYSLRVDPRQSGAVVGTHRVRISTKGDKAEEAPDGGGKVYPDKVPRRYNDETTLKCEVPPGGKTDADYDLKAP